MQGYFKICNAVYWVSLAVWLAALVAAGVAAANVFGTLGETPLRLEQYAAYPAQEHARLAAGLIMESVFFTVDLIQFVAIPLTVLMLVAQLSVFGMPLKSVANLGRALCIVIAAGMFVFHATAVAPKMNRPPRSGVRGVPVPHRSAQSHRADLEARDLGRWRHLVARRACRDS